MTGIIPAEMAGLSPELVFSVGYNGLVFENEAVRDFFNAMPMGQGMGVQTEVPGNLTAEPLDGSTIRLWWDHPQEFPLWNIEVYIASAPGGPYTLHGVVSGYPREYIVINGLAPGIYYFKIRNHSDAHDDNANEVDSPFSPEVQCSTAGFSSITAVTPNGGETWTGGTVQTVSWTTFGSVGSVDISYSTSGPNHADFNKDGKPDLIWRYYGTGGKNVIWFMDNTTRTGYRYLPSSADLNWKIVAAGDFNGDGSVDIVWRNHATGDNVIWYLDGSAKTGHSFFTKVPNLNWDIENN